jgi:hypothetical protein
VSVIASATSAPWPIGDPGRAATGVRPGRPVSPAGHGDVVVSWAQLGAIRTTGASVRGLMHRHGEEPRQDAFALGERRSSEGVEELIAVVCDGVGSLERSHEAAELVSRRMVEEGAAGTGWPEAVLTVNEELRAIAVEGDAKVMATTVVALAVERDGAEWVGRLAWVGDSSCWHLDGAGRWSELTATENATDAAYHSSSVRPLPSTDGGCRALAFRVTGGALFLMSDGVSNPLRWSGAVQTALTEWWQAPCDPLTFAGQVGFSAKSHNDDRTVVAIWHESTDEDQEHEDRTVAA